MSVGRLLTLGFGVFGGVHFLPTLGYGAGAPIPASGDLGLGHRGSLYRLRKRKELRDAIAALYESPAAAQTAYIVRPFARSEAEFPLEAIDWKALRADVEAVSRIIELYAQEQENEEEMIFFGL